MTITIQELCDKLTAERNKATTAIEEHNKYLKESCNATDCRYSGVIGDRCVSCPKDYTIDDY